MDSSHGIEWVYSWYVCVFSFQCSVLYFVSKLVDTLELKQVMSFGMETKLKEMKYVYITNKQFYWGKKG